MSLTAFLVLTAQAASPAAQAEAPAAPPMVSARASARILPSQSIRFETLEQTGRDNPAAARLRVDSQGTRWIDFS